MILVAAGDEAEALSIVAALHIAADAEDTAGGDRMAARRWRARADAIADQLEAVTAAARPAGQREGGPSERVPTSIASASAG